ncbi:unnamed protein product, partial [Phaeothamnion confervicola]
RVYAGVPTACDLPTNPNNLIGRVIKDPTDKWYDEKFVNHTLRGLDCYPVYMQGAFYVLSYELVKFLEGGIDHYVTFTNEDVTVGSWLLGVDREVVPIHDVRRAKLWDCVCAQKRVPAAYRRDHVFFHNCKEDWQLQTCHNQLHMPGLLC